MNDKRIVEVVGAIIKDGDRYLVGQRAAGKSWGGTYAKVPKISRQKGCVIGFLVVAFAFVSLVFGDIPSRTVYDQFGNATTYHSDGSVSRTVHDQFGNATTHRSDGSSSRTVYDQFGNATTHHSDGSVSRTVHDQLGNATTHRSDGSSSRTVYDQFGNATTHRSDGSVSRTVHDQFGNATTHRSDGSSSRTVYDQFGNATTHHSDGSVSRTVHDQLGNATTHRSGGSSSRTVYGQFGNATTHRSDGVSTRSGFRQSASTLGTSVSDATTYPYGTTQRSVGGHDADQPISFHTGTLPQPEQGDFERQRQIWEQNALRRLHEAAQRGTYVDAPHADEERFRREMRDSPVARQLYKEYMRKVGEQYAQQYYNTFGVYPNETGNHLSRNSLEPRSYFRWILLLVALALLCKWMWGNRHEMKKREFWTARRALTLLQVNKAFSGIKACMCWLCVVSKKVFEGRILGSGKRMHHACTDQRPEVVNVPEDAIGLKERGKAVLRRICPKWIRVILEGGPKRTCKVCGTENSARAAVCCNCGITFERPKIKPTQTRKRGLKSRNGAYSRFINKGGN